MGDIHCAVCREPWDAYGVRNGDMTPEEAAKFLHGKGCPSCGFGTMCPSCDGTGREQNWGSDDCPVCRGFRRVTIRRLTLLANGAGPRGRDGEWQYGYHPNAKLVPEEVLEVAKITDRRHFGCLEGRAEEGRIPCWNCTAPPCEECKGTGKFTAKDPAAVAERRAAFQTLAQVNGSDEDGLQSDLEDLVG